MLPTVLCGAALLMMSFVAPAQTAMSHGLVGVGRLSPEGFDQLGASIDSIGGIGSSIFVNSGSIQRSGDAGSGFTYSGTLYSVPDRGFNGATLDYHPRLQTFEFSITPYYGTGPVPQNQIVLSNSVTTVFTYGGTNFTGFEPNDTNSTFWPQSPAASLGKGHRSLDPEGLARANDGTFYVSDEYGPHILHFDASGSLIERFVVPEAFIPKRGTYPGANVFGTNAIVSGRIRNRGFEGLSITPDGRRLVAALQSPLQQDGNASAVGRNSRLLLFDLEAGSATYGRLVAEYVYQLTLNGNATTNRQTLVSEVLALNTEQFLVLERDSLGLGDTTSAASNYKAIVMVDTHGATNIANTGYDLERGAPGSLQLPTGAALNGIAPVARHDVVQIIDPQQLARFGLNMSTNKDSNTLTEKWEGLALIPLRDLEAPDDYLLLTANDNDFTSFNVYQNGALVGTNALSLDNMMLAYRVTLPGVGATAPGNALPGVTLVVPPNPTLSAPATFTLTANVYDQDGIITRVEFFEAGVKIGEDATYPFELPLTDVMDGSYTYTAVAWDNSGANTTSAAQTVIVTPDNLLPIITIQGPSNPKLSAPATVLMSATASDPDGTVSKVEFYEDGAKIGQKASAPYTFTRSNVLAGVHAYTAVVSDNHGATKTSSAVEVHVTPDNLPPEVRLLTPASDFTGSQPTNILFTAEASDPDGTVAKVEYYRAETKIGQATVPPYSFVFSNFPAGTSLVRAIAFDNQGTASAEATATLTILDTVAPVILCPTNRTVACTDPAGTPVSFLVTATDNLDPTIVVVCTPPSGSLFSLGTTLVTCIAKDAAGNTSTCSFNVIVQPSDVTIELAVIIRWNCGETLQGADDLSGPWIDIPGATSPYALTVKEARRFYRVKN